ncbi:MAG TPA: serine/threonine-protein kinase [Gallionellaceae bacterium]|nr:serine/threonine-protein kinase [Gallionellaceae bacterium]
MVVSTNTPEQLARKICTDQGLSFVGEVGAGAFKQTYLVRSHDDDLALKLIIRGNDKARIDREIAALMVCNHPNICRLLKTGKIDDEANSVVYLIEEFLPGGTLSEQIAKGFLQHANVIQLAVKLTEAIAHLAEHRITHRDIKPDNIMFRADGTPVLVDLGIARHLEASSLTKTFLLQGPGTPLFAPPEQLLNDKNLIDWRSDQFSLGVTLSYAAFGIHPFAENASLDHTVERVANRQPSTEHFRKLISERGFDALAKMVEVWPVKRFARPEMLLAAWRDNLGRDA